MSTKSIRRLTELVERIGNGDEFALAVDARAELEAIRKAAQTLERLGFDLPPSASLGDVQAYSDAECLLSTIAEEAK